MLHKILKKQQESIFHKGLIIDEEGKKIEICPPKVSLAKIKGSDDYYEQ